MPSPSAVPFYAWFAERNSSRGTRVFAVWKESSLPKGVSIWTSSYLEGDSHPRVVQHGKPVDLDEANRIAAGLLGSKLKAGYKLWKPPATASGSPEGERGTSDDPGPGIDELRAWLAKSGKVAEVIVRHPAIDRFEIGAPLMRGAKQDLRTIAVERTTYFGIDSRYLSGKQEQFEALLDGLAHGFDGGNIRIADESMDECVADDRWRIEETDYFTARSGRWTRLSASATKRFDGKSDDASAFAAALLVPAEPVAESITLRTGRKPKSPAKELVVTLGSSATSHSVAAALADALGVEIPRKRRRSRVSVPDTVWPRCNPRVRGLSESSQSAG